MAESLSEIFERLLAKQQILLERYNAMKDKLQISQEENEALKVFRLALSANVGKIVKTAMGLLVLKCLNVCKWQRNRNIM